MDTKVTPQRHKVLVPWVLGIAAVCTVVVLVVLWQPLPMKRSTQRVPLVSSKSLHLVHPVFGEAHETVAVDEHPVVGFSVRDQIRFKLGLGTPPSPPPVLKRTNLLIGQTPMWWSAGGTAGGYLYCHLMSSPQPLWQFAPSDKTNLIDVMPQDFLTTFVSMGDKTNGLAAFGTNWWRHGIRIRQGQIILARLVGDPAYVYALEIAEQNLTNAVVYYLQKPL
jgi:hypothetical protein